MPGKGVAAGIEFTSCSGAFSHTRRGLIGRRDSGDPFYLFLSLFPNRLATALPVLGGNSGDFSFAVFYQRSQTSSTRLPAKNGTHYIDGEQRIYYQSYANRKFTLNELSRSNAQQVSDILTSTIFLSQNTVMPFPGTYAPSGSKFAHHPPSPLYHATFSAGLVIRDRALEGLYTPNIVSKFVRHL
ncbi:hypothetical protein F4604DRAFT_1675375 [Suillus subluteus]|nr:hypothetical protein F4604DRAFT_1675375 [Suillus subluteus]